MLLQYSCVLDRLLFGAKSKLLASWTSYLCNFHLKKKGINSPSISETADRWWNHVSSDLHNSIIIEGFGFCWPCTYLHSSFWWVLCPGLFAGFPILFYFECSVSERFIFSIVCPFLWWYDRNMEELFQKTTNTELYRNIGVLSGD
jgi:hypothetical protein